MRQMATVPCNTTRSAAGLDLTQYVLFFLALFLFFHFLAFSLFAQANTTVVYDHARGVWVRYTSLTILVP
jgi:hypothetical protein